MGLEQQRACCLDLLLTCNCTLVAAMWASNQLMKLLKFKLVVLHLMKCLFGLPGFPHWQRTAEQNRELGLSFIHIFQKWYMLPEWTQTHLVWLGRLVFHAKPLDSIRHKDTDALNWTPAIQNQRPQKRRKNTLCNSVSKSYKGHRRAEV